MIQSIIAFSAKNRWLVILIVAAAVAYTGFAIKQIRLDAIPDLSDTQVIIYTRWDRSPDILEDQVTYPIITSLLGAPKVKAIRGFSDFGFSYVYVIFEDGTDIYWARSRVLEYMQKITGSLPAGVNPEIGPDATGVGWVYSYALVDRSGKHDLAALRTYQDWYLRYALQSVPGVAEIASFGGFQKQYQVTVDPNRLQSYGVGMTEIMEAIKRSNNEVGGRLIEWSGKEFMVRSRGYIQDTDALEKVVVKADPNGAPVLLRDLATIALGPQIRRGIGDFNGEGDTVGAIVVMRHGENALNVIDRVKTKIEELKASLPEGVEIVSTYDRSGLIRTSIENLKHELTLTMIVVSCVILVFLWHVPSAIVPIITIPTSVLLAFIPMYLMGISSNIMSLAGIAISIGVLVDGAIVEVENAYKKIERWIAEGRQGDFHQVRLQALMEVGPSVFFSLAVIAVAFLPVFALVDQEGRLFKPLAYTKNLTMLLAAVLAITLDPAIRMLFARIDPFKFRPSWLARVATTLAVGSYKKEEDHPVSGLLMRLYEKPCRWTLEHPLKTIAIAVLLVLSTIPVYRQLGHEFMPPLQEGTILYMPTTLPGISVTEAQKLLETQDRILRSFPEVLTIHGKAGRAETSTDPAPFSMMETTVVLKPKEEWRAKERWYSKRLPDWLKAPLRQIWPEHISHEELVAEMDKAIQIPGNVNAWTMPIKGRIDMLSTGVRTPIGIKILGSNLEQIEQLGAQIESVMRKVPGTRSAFAERAAGGYFVDFVPNREALARYGLTIDDVQSVIMTAIGGETISTTVEGRERYSINLRYPRDLRQDLDQLQRILVTARAGKMEPNAVPIQVPMSELAEIKLVSGPSMIRNENGMLAGYVFVDIAGRDIGSYVKEAKQIVRNEVKLPTGYSLVWSGQYENMARVQERMKIVLPITIFLIFVLLYMNTGNSFKTMLVMLAVPFSLVGAVWFMWLLDYNISVATWVGMIALMGLDAETGVFMLMFLDLSYDEAVREGKMRNRTDLKEAIIHGAVKRLRPKMMTVMCAFLGLMPIMWSAGTGSDMIKRVAAPLAGGLATSFVMELLVYPAIYLLWRSRALKAIGRIRPIGPICLILCLFATGSAQAGPGDSAPAKLETILAAVRRDNPSVRAARARWKAMKLRVPQARAWEDPRFGVDVERMGATRFTSYSDTEWMLSQQVPVSGKNRSRARAADAEARAGFEEFRRAELDALSKARAAWFRLANLYAQLEINQRNRELLGQLAEISRVKYESGTQSQNAVLVAQTELLRLNETRSNLERDLVAQQSALNMLMGRPASSTIIKPEPLAFTVFKPGSIERFAIANRPEIALAARRIEAAEAGHQLAKRQWIPDPELRLEARNFRENDPVFREYDTGIFFSIPWGNWRKYSAGIAEAQKRVEAAQADLIGARIELSVLVRDQLQTIESAAKNYLLFRDQLMPLARQSVESARAGYESNKVEFAELISAQRTLQEVDSGMIEHLANYRVAVSELEAIAGGKPSIGLSLGDAEHVAR